MSAATILGRLDGVRQTGDRRWVARCPAHDDRRPSLSLCETDEGRVLVHCHAGCVIENVLGAVGLDFDALYPPHPIADRLEPVRKPWRVSDVVAALRGELYVGAVLLMNVAAGYPPTAADRERARVAVERIGIFLDELRHAG